MVSTEFLIVSVVALVIFGWHVFVIMQLWPPESYLFDDSDNQSPNIRPDQHSLDDVRRPDSQRSEGYERNHQRPREKDADFEEGLMQAQKHIDDMNEILDEYENDLDIDYEAEKQHIEDQWDRINEAKDRIGLN